ncbi:ParA family protein [Thalassotalea litorea]|uniref:ParA family protein n=1 Tax=Thalassotalea litorea TaxID=2020715 RepID=UPI003735E388
MKVVSFVNMKGGVAKTTLSINVADCMSRRHELKVLIIDLDPQFNATQALVHGTDYVKHIETGGHTIVDVFDDTPRVQASSVNGESPIEPVELEQVLPMKLNSNMYLLPGALDLYRLDMSAGQGREHRLKRYINTIKDSELFDIVIIDTPPTPSTWMSAALIASDYYLVPVKPEPLSVTGIDLLRNVINRVKENYSLALECLGVVLTIADERETVYKNAVHYLDSADFWKGKRFNKSLLKRTEVARLQGSQKLVLDTNDPKSKMAIADITREALQHLGLEE